MNFQVPVDILENSTVSRGIGNGQVHRGFRTIRHIRRINAKRLFPQFRHGLIHRREVIQYILRPDTDSHHGPIVIRPIVRWFREIQQIGNQTFLVHPVCRADIIPGSDDTAVFGCPLNRVTGICPGTLHSPREYIQIRTQVFLPIHRSTRNDHPIRSQINHPGTSLSRVG